MTALKTRETERGVARVAAPRLPPGDEVEPLVELREQARDLGRVVLTVAVDRDDDVAARLRRSRPRAPPPCRSCGAGGRRARSSCAACRRVSAAKVPSVEPSSTKTASQGSPTARARPRARRRAARRSAPRCAPGRRPRARRERMRTRVPRGRLLTIEDALARVLARVRPLEPSPCPRRGRGARARRRSPGARRPAPVRELRDGRVRAPGDRHARTPAGRGADRGRAGRRSGARGRRGDGDRDRRRGPGRRRRVVPIEHVGEHDNAIEIPYPLRRGAHVRPAGGDVRSGETSAEPESASERRRSARSPPPAWRRFSARGARASPSSAPAPSCGAG